MTKETKIGLLVGLAFIILFAIILSEKRGTGRDATLPVYAIADANRKVSSTTGTERPLDGAGVVAVPRKLPPVTDNRPTSVQTANAAKSATEQTPVIKDQAQLDIESLAELLNPPKESTSGEKPKEVPSVTLGEAVAQALEDKDAIPSPIVPKIEPPVEKVASALKQVPTPDLTPSEPPAASSEQQPAKKAEHLPIKTTHEVQPGESLGKIAAKYYGRSTPQRVEALYNANRDVLPSVNAVKANVKLNIPDLGEKNDQFEPVSSFAGTQLADARKAGMDKQPIVPLPIGDRTQPREKQRDPASVGRAAPAAIEKTTTDQPKVENAASGKTVAEKPASDKGSPGKDKAGKSPAETKSGKPKPEKPAAEKSKAQKPTTDPKYEWYEVRESDTLGKIAARKLGDQKLYSEILRLNKDRINDKNVLKPGVKLRLPAKTAPGSPLETAVSATSGDLATP
jgi:nucleoid-associated protein YgaU